ncbi:hypothetical protein GCM10009789_07870 [Kribbella sancticallisti]|uniref:Aminoglycoside phosphotransferase domain-containing protein n=1 Tax=Kribbella sancticallisti TaxID=460087 RepID=A0ABN2CFT3_9ACTN
MAEHSDPLELLTGPSAGEVLAAAVSATGAELLSWQPVQVDHQTDRTTVAYRTQLSTGSAVLCATVGGSLPAGVTVVGDEELQVGVWLAGNDPLLPGMRAAMDPVAVSSLFESLGLGSGAVRLELRSYRPLRRAVVEATGLAGRLFLKVVPPGKVEALHKRHRLLAGGGVPAPRSLGWTDDGLLVLETLPGRTLRGVLRSSGELPDPSALIEMLDRLPVELVDAPRRSSWLERTEYYARSVGDVVPELAARSAELATTIVAESHVGPVVPVHSDFYEAQILVDGRGVVTGLLDVDTAGPGDRIDDLACLVGHLSVLAEVLPRHAAAIDEYGARCLATFDRHVDPRQLRLRIASVVLSLATGPHRVQEPGWRQATCDRLNLAERWVNRSDSLHDERNHHVSNA